MKLEALLAELDQPLSIAGSPDVDIAEVRDDSRAVGAGDLFVAVPGLTVDGHRFLADVAARGAAAVIVEHDVPAEVFPGTRIRVASSAAALAHVAARRFGEPANAMRMIAVTGTNGKTTTTYVLEAMLAAANRRPGVIGTVNYRYAGKSVAANFTTPTALELQRLLAEMRDAGTTDVVMEASSHALAMGRLDGIDFRAAAFTNLTQDHLDFHHTMDSYFEAKALLMRQHLRHGEGVGVIFVDDPWGPKMASAVIGERILVSLENSSADVHVRRAESTLAGIVAELASPLGAIQIRSRLVGRYNLANLAVAAGVGVALGLDIPTIERGIASLAGVPGRIERVDSDEGLAVLVDYAHTHDALENVIAALRPLTSGRLICVFGCGGDRDKTKRPRMGRVVATGADLAIVTSDNPRTEEPGAIIEMILTGVGEVGAPRLAAADLPGATRGFYVEADRRKAIEAAILAMHKNDVLLIAGKGHEDYQIIGKTKFPFDDRLVAREALARRPVERQG